MDAIDFMLFGGKGDLARRKLIPALFQLHCRGELAPTSRIIGLSRSKISSQQYQALLSTALIDALGKQNISEDDWNSFKQRIEFLSLDGNNREDFLNLKTVCKQQANNRCLFYLATQPSLYVHICRNLAEQGIITKTCRVILEKPVGNNLHTAQEINRQVATWFSEEQTYRIDHYLGKETVQNLLVLRFANTLFESQWNNHYIDHIQITIAETLGVEQRGLFFEQVGTMRDMVQNHLLQLLCIIAMEPPHSSAADSIRDEKLKVLKALRPITEEAIKHKVVRGQYDQATVDGQVVNAYRNEKDIPPFSNNETFVALKAEIDNWRWAGVPFYLRTGKRMASSLCEIVVEYKKIPHSIFDSFNPAALPNKLIIQLQPNEAIRMRICEKKIGPGMNVQHTELNLSPERANSTHIPGAYERLLQDAVNGNTTLFMRGDELEAAWAWVDPIIDDWQKNTHAPSAYPAGSWGPTASSLLLAKDGRLWNEMS